MKVRQHRILAAVVAVGISGVACGGSDPPPARAEAKPANAEAKPAAQSGGKGGKGGKAKGKRASLQVYDKVPDALRKELTRADFLADPTGDINRDPFRSYLVQPAAAQKAQTNASEDECARRTIAPKYGLRDLKLAGVVMKGTQSYALFIDGQKLGHIAHRGDCISKERVRLKDIGADRVILEVRGDAPPGAPAPPPRDEVWRLHPSELELTDDQLNPGAKDEEDVEIGAEW